MISRSTRAIIRTDVTIRQLQKNHNHQRVNRNLREREKATRRSEGGVIGQKWMDEKRRLTRRYAHRLIEERGRSFIWVATSGGYEGRSGGVYGWRGYIRVQRTRNDVQGNTLLLFPSQLVPNFSLLPLLPPLPPSLFLHPCVLLYIFRPSSFVLRPTHPPPTLRGGLSSLFLPPVSLNCSPRTSRLARVRFVPRERENVNGIAD